MRFSSLASTAALAMTAFAAVVPDVSGSSTVAAREDVKEEVTDMIEKIKADFLADLNSEDSLHARAGKPPPKCTGKNIKFRKE